MSEDIIYGIHAVKALLERDPTRFKEVYVLKGREDRRLMPVIHALEEQGILVQVANRQWLDNQTEGAVHQGIIAKVKPSRQYQEQDLPDLLAEVGTPFLLVLDGVTDPHNLGACLRSADAAGVHAVIVPKDRSAQLNAHGEKSRLWCCRKRTFDPCNQSGTYFTLTTRREHLDCWHGGGSGSYIISKQTHRAFSFGYGG